MLAYFRCLDYLVGVLPGTTRSVTKCMSISFIFLTVGDDYYPNDTLDHKDTIQMNCSSTQFTENTKNVHRLIYRDVYDLYVTSNIIPIDGHFTPILHFKHNSKL